tara:strand:+ start:34793 stop:35479 length:687 start_codon:yes stop_codon:yes gene_type:complete
MKKFFKFIFQAILIILIVAVGMSYCGYHLLGTAVLKKTEKVGTEVLGSQLIINFQGQKGDKYAVVIKDPPGFSNGNMIMIQNISSTETERKINQGKKTTTINYTDYTINKMTINYAVNNNDQINLKITQDNIMKYSLQNQDNFNKITTELLKNNNKSNSTINKIKSITFVNPSLALFIDGKYRNSSTISSFSVQLDDNESSNFLNVIIDVTKNLVKQADAVVYRLVKN